MTVAIAWGLPSLQTEKGVATLGLCPESCGRLLFRLSSSNFKNKNFGCALRSDP